MLVDELSCQVTNFMGAPLLGLAKFAAPKTMKKTKTANDI